MAPRKSLKRTRDDVAPADAGAAAPAEAETEDAAAAADAEATIAVMSLLDAIKAMDAVDTTNEQGDSSSLLQKGRLLSGRAGRETMKSQLKPSIFLKSELKGPHKFVTTTILPQFAKRLVKERLAQRRKNLLLHMNLGKARVAYFETDRPLMKKVLKTMNTAIESALDKRIADGLEFFTALGWTLPTTPAP